MASLSRFLGVLMLVAVAPVQAVEPIYTGWFSDVAVDGYDVVSYFDTGEPVEGREQFTMRWRGAEWRFASADHLERFREDPASYAPAYGGYCAWAVAHGDTAAGDPRHWAIVDGRLYLNYDAGIQRKWAARKEELIRQADRNWPDLIDR